MAIKQNVEGRGGKGEEEQREQNNEIDGELVNKKPYGRAKRDGKIENSTYKMQTKKPRCHGFHVINKTYLVRRKDTAL